jgi:hypothetical protein
MGDVASCASLMPIFRTLPPIEPPPPRFAERLKLVGVDLDAGAKGRLEQLWIRCGDTVLSKVGIKWVYLDFHAVIFVWTGSQFRAENA